MSLDAPAVQAPHELSRNSPGDTQRRRSPVINAWTASSLGAVVALIGGMLAYRSGANLALTLLVAYCAITSTAGLACVVYASREPAPPAGTPATQEAPDTSLAWRLLNVLTVSDASRLWCGIEPGATATQETIAWGRALLDAVKSGELALVAKPGTTDEACERERQNPHYMTQLSRESLKTWASRHGHAPDFLRG